VNLHGIVASVVGYVNPLQPVVIQTSSGSSTTDAGKRTPNYDPPISDPSLQAQVQELTQSDVRQLEGLNIQGSQRAIYVNGALSGVVRWSRRGGDLLTLQDNTVWLTTAVLEQWPDWVKVSVTLQNGS
jgi:hypothetical protein